jgi:hypothetical protein
MEKLVEGWTEPIRQQLLKDGDVWDATGASLALLIHDKNGAAVALAGSVVWSDATQAIAQYTPASGDLPASGSPYTATWQLAAGGQVAYWPNAAADLWLVRTP